MGLFDRIFGRKNNVDSRAYKREQADRLSGMLIKYVTERHADDVEEVIGKNGGLNIRDDEFIVFASADIIMRCKIEDMQAWELMSHDGVVITAPDLEHGGVERTIIVHYVYYR